MFGQGVDYVGEVLDIGVEYNVVQRAGAFYSYNGERLGQGRENSKNYLKETPELLDTIAEQVRAALLQNNKNTTPIATPVDDDEDFFDEED
jgi:recombination protein RecA